MRLRAGDAGDLLQMEDVPRFIGAHGSEEPSAQCSTECRAATSRRAARAAAGGRARAAARRGLGVVAVEAQLRGQQVVEDRVRREHRQARRCRLVDDLVGRARAHVVDEHVAAREELGHLRSAPPGRRARHRRRTRATRELALVLLERRVGAVRLDVRARERGAARGSSRAPSPANSGRARARAACSSAGASVHGNSSTSMPWPIACTFCERSGNERSSTETIAVQTFSAARTTACALPVRVPEHERDAAAAARAARRARRRAGPCARRRRAAAAQLARERAPRTCAPRCSCVGAPNSCTRTFAGTTPGTAVSQSTTSSSTRAASARTIGTVAARTGSPGSSFCVAKTSLRIRRSRGRRA